MINFNRKPGKQNIWVLRQLYYLNLNLNGGLAVDFIDCQGI